MIYSAGKTNAGGHAETIIKIQEKYFDKVIRKDSQGWYVPITASISSKKPRVITGKARVIEKGRTMVVSDIDDTIKITAVRDRNALIENTFYREFIPVPGMARAYRAMAGDGALFHYVSASPWQLYRSLTEFLSREGFPDGLFYMKYFDFSSNLQGLFASSDTVKIPYIRMLMEKFPAHRFVLVGDSGERDPEIYGGCARSLPGRIIGIYIRNVTGEKPDNARMTKAFKGVPPTAWRLFDRAEELETDMRARRR